MKNVIIISAHPDDETIGAGGTLIKHKQAGDNIFWIIVTNVLENQGFSKDRINSRQNEISTVAKIFNFKETFKLDYPTATLTPNDLLTIIPKISSIFNQVKPEIVYCLNRSDAHSDHRITFDAIMACTKSFRYPFVKKVLMYECISETEFAPQLPENQFIPNYFVDISTFMNEKLAILDVFESEMGNHPFPRSKRNIQALATFRGATAGCEYAEAFQVVKIIE